MDKSEFPSLEEANTTSDNATSSSSWAKIASQPPSKNEEEEGQTTPPSDHTPNVWEANKQNASFADIAGHEKHLKEEFPTPQESVGGAPNIVENDILPPNPERSFAEVTSNKDFPTPEKDTDAPDASLSDLPDVKDMLNKPSVHVPPPPANQSFAKITAKEIPPENRPLSDRAKALLKEQESQPEEEPLSLNDDNFPTLSQSNLMAEKNASNSREERQLYAEISRLNQLEEAVEDVKEEKKDVPTEHSFADIVESNLDDAPPPAKSHVDQHPVFDENTVYSENVKREARKNLNIEHGNNKQLKEEEELTQVEPTKEQRDQEQANEETYNTSRKVVSDEPEESTNIFHAFDKDNTGRITVFQTALALYRLGYPWLSIIPGALFMHLRLSPLTSPYSFPFIYRSPLDFILLPIYTNKLRYALTKQTPLMHQRADTLVNQYGNRQGLGFWDGMRALDHLEKGTLKWYQLGSWAMHRIQWTLTFTMLHDPKSNVVTTPTLASLVTCEKLKKE